MIHKTSSLHQGQKKVECFISVPSSLPCLPLCYSHLPVSETPPSRAQQQLSTWRMGSIFLESFVLNVLGVCPDRCDKQTNCWLKSTLDKNWFPNAYTHWKIKLIPWLCVGVSYFAPSTDGCQGNSVVTRFPISQNGSVCNQNMEETIILAMSNFVICFFSNLETWLLSNYSLWLGW